MKPVLVASTDSEEARKISEIIAKEYKVAIIGSADMLGSLINASAMVILDHSFYVHCGPEFFKGLLKHPHPPFLMLTPPDDIRTIVDIMEIGIGYIPKVPDYQRLLSLSANNTLAQIDEKEQLKRNVLSLKQRVEELGKAQSEQRESPQGKPFQKTKPPEEKGNILDEIVVVFKRGEIELPTLPQMSIKFQEMMDIGANLQVIGAFLKQDMAISSKLISVSNSAYYRGVTESKNIGQAVSRLGLNNTKRYVDAICNRSLYATKNKRFLTLIERLWEHSIACAYATQVLEESLALSLENDAFTMGLLHDIGKLLLLQVIGQLQLKKKIGDQIEDTELLDTIKVHHGKFGAALLKKWNFSEGFSKIAVFHDNLDKADVVSNDLLVVHFGNLMAISMGFALNNQKDVQPAEIDLVETESARRLGLDDSMIDEFKHKVSGFMNETKGLFG